MYMQHKTTGEIYETSTHWGDDFEQLTNAKGAELYRAQQCADLRKILKAGQTVYTSCEQVSASGMSRRISLYIVVKGDIVNITRRASIITGFGLSKNGGLIVQGCGMDMGFHAVYTLGRNLWPKGTRKPHGTRNGAPDKDGGYALKHSWL
jgi:hypothetical protein